MSPPPTAFSQAEPRRPASLRYVGFEQNAGMRSYGFERTPHGEYMKTVVVTTDMAIFTQHLVPFQESLGGTPDHDQAACPGRLASVAASSK